MIGKHPGKYFVKYLLIRNEDITDPEIMNALDTLGMLPPDEKFLPTLRLEVQGTVKPRFLNLSDKTHRDSVLFLREQGVYDLFHPDDAMEEAQNYLKEIQKRVVVEDLLFSPCLDILAAVHKINQLHGWYLSVEAVEKYQHYFWNVNLLTFEEWSKFLFQRTPQYEKRLALLNATPSLAQYHLKIDQHVESKTMIQRAQEIAFHTLEEVAIKPGTGADKVKAVSVLTKAIVECHQALSTSDMALKDVLKQFERFRMEHPQQVPPAIKQLAPMGNFSGSGLKQESKDDVVN